MRASFLLVYRWGNLLRSDFQDIYEFTYDLGMRISLFTNGTLISDEVVNYLKKRKPDLVAITLYGINPHQYQEITGSAQAFSQVSSAIKRLKEAKITVVVRTIAVQTIYRHLDDVINYLKELHLPVSYSLYVGPKRSCLGSSNIERLNPEQLVIYQSQFKQAFGESLTIELSDCLESFRCLAGKSSYFIRWDGMMMPCAMLEYPSFMAKDDFARAWKKLNLAINNVPLCEGYEDCSVRSFCLQCPARRYLEGGFAQCSPYLKAIATLLKEGKQ